MYYYQPQPQPAMRTSEAPSRSRVGIAKPTVALKTNSSIDWSDDDDDDDDKEDIDDKPTTRYVQPAIILPSPIAAPLPAKQKVHSKKTKSKELQFSSTPLVTSTPVKKPSPEPEAEVTAKVLAV